MTDLLPYIVYFLCIGVPLGMYIKHVFRAKAKKRRTVIEVSHLISLIALGALVGKLFIRLTRDLEAIPVQVLAGCMVIAFIPLGFWFHTLFLRRTVEMRAPARRAERIKMFAVVLLGMLTVPLLNYWYDFVFSHPSVDYYHWLHEWIVAPTQNLLDATSEDSPLYFERYYQFKGVTSTYNTLTIVIDAFLEEAVKLSLLIMFVRMVGAVKTIGDAITFSVLSGLGFAYVENILFFTDVYLSPESTSQLFLSVVIFRTIVLSIGHMTFSGIFGYFYGLAKFGKPIFREQRWEGRPFPLVRLVSFITRVSPERTFSFFLFFEGLLLAMVAHATFNSFLGYGLRDYAVYLIIVFAIYVYYLTQRRAGHLVLSSLGKSRYSLMAPKDEDVVLELAGMWINEGRYKEVEEMCERLEKKDPDNAVIKLLKARAHDKRRLKRARLALISLFFQEDIFEDDVSIFERWQQIRAERLKKA